MPPSSIESSENWTSDLEMGSEGVQLKLAMGGELKRLHPLTSATSATNNPTAAQRITYLISANLLEPL